MRNVAVGLLFLLFATPSPAAPDGDPDYRRIVSVNLAADELILQLADPARIVALSRLASDPELSRLADRAAELPSTDGSAEHILRLKPDIVFASEYTRRTTTDLLERIGIKVVRLPVANNLDECRKLVREVAGILGVRERGEALVEEMDRRLDGLKEKTASRGNRPTALVYGQSGYTQGDGTLIHHILEAAGLKNHAVSLGISGQAKLPLEKLLLSPPDFLVLLPYYENDTTLGSQLLRHRALRQLPERMRVVELPLAWTLTGNNLTALSAAHLHEQTEAALDTATTKEP